MRSSIECLAKADELEVWAIPSDSPDMRARFLDIARDGRDFARQALAQNVTFAPRPPERWI